MRDEALLDALFQVSPQVRYAAVRRGGEVTMRQREGIDGASAAESDRWEELLVNPALLVLTTRRGEVDCGGLRYLLVRYGRFFQFVRALPDGHVSVSLEPGADVVGLAGQLDALLRRLD